jgi:serine/threonine protein kinase
MGEIRCYKRIQDVPFEKDSSSPVGRGAFGSVYRARDRNTPKGKPVAIKEIAIKNGDHRKQVEHEIRLLSKFQHRNILKLVEAYRINEPIYCNLICLATTPYARPSFQEFLENVRSHHIWELCRWYNEEELHPWPSIMEGCLSGLEYLHSRVPPIRHRDLKPDNILFDYDPDSGAVLPVIIDFGISKEHLQGQLTTVSGTEQFKAPEQLENDEQRSKDLPKKSLTPATDIFSLGCCFALIEGILRGNPGPHEIDTVAGIWRHSIGAINSLLYQEALPANSAEIDHFAFFLRPVVETMMDENPENRPSARKCKKYITDIPKGWKAYHTGQQNSSGCDIPRPLPKTDIPKFSNKTEVLETQKMLLVEYPDMLIRVAFPWLPLEDTAEGPGVFENLNNLANSLREQGKYAEAEVICRQTVQLQEMVLGKDHPDTLRSMNSLANSLREQGKYVEAMSMYRQTLQLRQTVLGRDHPDTLRSMNNLASSLNQQGKHAEAEAMHRQTLQLKQTVLGKNHQDTLRSMNNLADSLNRQGKHAEAEAMHRQTMQLMEMVLGKDHPDMQRSMNNLADSLNEQGKSYLVG